MKLKMKLVDTTKTCYRFESGSRAGDDLRTMYLKKTDIDAAGIDPAKGITVTVEEVQA